MRVEYGTTTKPRILEVPEMSLRLIENGVIRNRINLELEDWEQLEDLGVKVVDQNCDSNCFGHVLGEGDVVDNFDELFNQSIIVSEGLGNIVLYINKDLDDKERIVHIGLVKDNQIISKWGKLPVMRHSLDMVPLSYGNKVVHLRKVL